MKNLYLMTHGETLFNQQNKIQGWCDSPLTEKGIAQAKRAGELISNVTFDHYYCSTAGRCSDTLEYAVGNVSYLRLKDLRERGFGKFEGEHEYLNPNVDDRAFNYDTLFPNYGGETTEGVIARMHKAIDAIMNDKATKNVLIVTHAGAGALFLRSVVDPSSTGSILRFPNGGLIHFRYEDGKYYFVEIIENDII